MPDVIPVSLFRCVMRIMPRRTYQAFPSGREPISSPTSHTPSKGPKATATSPCVSTSHQHVLVNCPLIDNNPGCAPFVLVCIIINVHPCFAAPAYLPDSTLTLLVLEHARFCEP